MQPSAAHSAGTASSDPTHLPTDGPRSCPPAWATHSPQLGPPERSPRRQLVVPGDGRPLDLTGSVPTQGRGHAVLSGLGLGVVELKAHGRNELQQPTKHRARLAIKHTPRAHEEQAGGTRRLEGHTNPATLHASHPKLRPRQGRPEGRQAASSNHPEGLQCRSQLGRPKPSSHPQQTQQRQATPRRPDAQTRHELAPGTRAALPTPTHADYRPTAPS